MLHTESTWNKKADWTLAAQMEGEMKDWILAFKVRSSLSTSSTVLILLKADGFHSKTYGVDYQPCHLNQ